MKIAKAKKHCRSCRYYDPKDKCCYLLGYRDIPFEQTCDRWIYNTDRFCDIINAHVRNAMRKHPTFVKHTGPWTVAEPNYTERALFYKEQLLKDNCLLNCLLSEVYEFLDEVNRGDFVRAEQEAADIVAVLIRVLNRDMEKNK